MSEPLTLQTLIDYIADFPGANSIDQNKLLHHFNADLKTPFTIQGQTSNLDRLFDQLQIVDQNQALQNIDRQITVAMSNHHYDQIQQLAKIGQTLTEDKPSLYMMAHQMQRFTYGNFWDILYQLNQ